MATIYTKFTLRSLYCNLFLDRSLNLSLLILLLHLLNFDYLELLDRLSLVLLLFHYWNRNFKDGLCLQLIDHLPLLVLFKYSLSLIIIELWLTLFGLFL